jgi:ATP-dependent phosphofructokinase / diphosphate-dependent phosphofructokinase
VQKRCEQFRFDTDADGWQGSPQFRTGGSNERCAAAIDETNMPDLIGNMLVAQSGGPTAVINSSLAGVIQAAGRHPNVIEELYGGLNGILGILNEDLIDIQEEKSAAIEGLKHTPAAALGTCRYKVDFKKRPDQAARDMERLFHVFQAHNIRYFFYIGGNDSQDTAHKIHEQAIERGFEMRVIGVPKTIDNDLPHTDHCPGYGSVIKYNATTVMEIATDVSSMATDDGSCCIVEVMGRGAGWIAAGSVLAKRQPGDAPHVILLPEVPFNEESFLVKVTETIARLKYCIVVVGEGLKNAAGEEIAADKSKLDAFGHPVLSGAAERVAEIVSAKLKTKTRTVKLGYAQRAAAHYASETDIIEAAACGEAAVRAAVSGQSGFMVKLVRNATGPYHCDTALHKLEEIANVEHLIPRDWISEDGFLPNEKFVEYARPLIDGELHLATEGGLPKFVTLVKVPVEKKLAGRG